MNIKKAEDVDWFLEQPKYIIPPKKNYLGNSYKETFCVMYLPHSCRWMFYPYVPIGIEYKKGQYIKQFTGYEYRRQSNGFFKLQRKKNVKLSDMILSVL